MITIPPEDLVHMALQRRGIFVPHPLKREARLDDDLRLDSLAVVGLVMDMEELGSMSIPDAAVGLAVTVGDLIDAVKVIQASQLGAPDGGR